jgi:hypothetical protein
MKVLLLACGALAASLLIAACGDPQPDVARSIYADDLTIEQVRDRATAAVTAKGVIHTSTSNENDPDRFVTDTWVDLEAEQARVEYNGEVARIFAGGLLAELHDRRYIELPYSESRSELDPLISYTLPHILLLTLAEEDVSIDDAVIDEAAAIRVRFKQEYGGDISGKETVSIYLDEQFLPVRIERRGPGSRSSDTTYETTFVAPDSLPTDHFSLDAVKALARTPEDDLADIAATGREVYWLGNTFEDMVLRGDSRIGTLPGEPEVSLSYGPADFSTPSPCVRISYESAATWSDILAARTNKGLIETERIDTTAGEFIVYAGAAAPPSGVTVILEPGQPISTAPALPDAAEDTGVYYEALATLGDGTGIMISPSCGPTGTNKYRSPEGLRLVLQSLRAFERDAPPTLVPTP